MLNNFFHWKVENQFHFDSRKLLIKIFIYKVTKKLLYKILSILLLEYDNFQNISFEDFGLTLITLAWQIDEELVFL